jgi:hypothetical protein
MKISERVLFLKITKSANLVINIGSNGTIIFATIWVEFGDFRENVHEYENVAMFSRRFLQR